MSKLLYEKINFFFFTIWVGKRNDDSIHRLTACLYVVTIHVQPSE